MQDQRRYEELAREIASADSPVGIDAKKTHIMILLMLERIEARLERVEQAVARAERGD